MNEVGYHRAFLSSESKLENFLPTESRQMEYQTNEINFHISQA